MNLIIGIDIGGTSIKGGLVTYSGKVKKSFSVSTQADKGTDIVLKNIYRVINKLMCKEVIGIGVGCPGPLDPKKGVILNLPNLPALENVELKKLLEEKYGCLVKIDNDANCFTLGEAVFGAGKKFRYVIGLTLGTGVGGGIVINKHVYHGLGKGGELGHTSINFDGLESSTGNTGVAEEYLAKRALEREAELLNVKTPLALFNLAEKRKILARNSFKNYGVYLGILLVNMLHTFDPGCIVIGGNISNAWKYFNKSMFDEIKKRALFNNAKIVKRKLGDDAGVLGAASQLVQREITKKQIKLVKKPWGEYRRFSYNEKSTVKILIVKPGQILSLQSHKNRDEMWVALDDGLQIQINKKIFNAKTGDVYIVPRGAKHRIASLKTRGRILEISFGTFDEEDIIRYQDRYGRIIKK